VDDDKEIKARRRSTYHI